MAIKIFITSTGSKGLGAWEHQLGNSAILISTINKLKDFIADSSIITDLQLSKEFCKKYDIEILKDRVFWEEGYRHVLESLIDLFKCSIWRFLKIILKLNIRILIKGNKLREYSSTDVIISLVGDTYSNNGVGWPHFIQCSAELITARLLGKPVILFTASPGPFYPKAMLFLAKFVLNRMTLILTREPLSKDYLQSIGVNKKNIISTVCPAFLLQPISKEEVGEILLGEGINEKNRPLIGIILAEYNFSLNPNRNIPPTFKDLSPYIQLVKYLLEDLKANIILIPHVYSTDQLTGKFIHGYDYTILEYLYNYVGKEKYDGTLKIIKELHTPNEVKAIIGQLDLLITGRLHAGIAALSLSVPTVLLAYGRKHYGVAKLFKQGKYVCTGKDAKEMIQISKYVWNNREKISKFLQARMVRVRELATLNFEIIKKIIDLDKKNRNHIPEEIIKEWIKKGELL